MSLIRYEDLEVYKLAFKAALRVHHLTLDFPKIEQFGGMADQLRRSSKSICANLGEGLGKRMSVPDKRRFIQIALGSAEECRVWLSFANELNYISSDESGELRELYERISRMLFKLQDSLKA